MSAWAAVVDRPTAVVGARRLRPARRAELIAASRGRLGSCATPSTRSSGWMGVRPARASSSRRGRARGRHRARDPASTPAGAKALVPLYSWRAACRRCDRRPPMEEDRRQRPAHRLLAESRATAARSIPSHAMSGASRRWAASCDCRTGLARRHHDVDVELVRVERLHRGMNNQHVVLYCAR